jgi:hypothetical protein
MNEGQSIDDIDGRPADGQLHLHMAQHYSHYSTAQHSANERIDKGKRVARAVVNQSSL